MKCVVMNYVYRAALYHDTAIRYTCSKEPDFWRLTPNYAAGKGEGAAIAGELDIVTFKLLFGGGGGEGFGESPRT
jgi:hypothetical protein